MRTRSALAVGSCLALLVGCSGSGGDGPKVLPTLSTSATASPTPTAVEVPAAARARTPQGADAFVHFFFAEMNEAFKTSDGDRIRRLTNGECGTCDNYASALDKASARGEQQLGEAFAVSGVAVPPLEEFGVIANVSGRLPARRVVDAAGKTIESIPDGGNFYFDVAVKWNGTWRVSGLRKTTRG